MKKNKKYEKMEAILSKYMQEVIAFSAVAMMLSTSSPFLFGAELKQQQHPMPVTNATPSLNGINEQNQLEHLREQLLQTTKELHDYKAKLFRPSHPKDETKIAELGKLVSEKEALNQQLAEALQNMDKEVIHARKQLMTNETSNDVLCSHIETQRQALLEKEQQQAVQIAQLQDAFQRERDQLLNKIALYETDQQNLLANLKCKEQTLFKWKNDFLQQRQVSKALLGEIADISNLLSVIDQIHQEKLSVVTKQNFTQLELSELITKTNQIELKQQIEQLAEQLSHKQLALHQLSLEMQELDGLFLAQIARAENLQQGEFKALAFAHDLITALSESQKVFQSSHEQQAATLDALEKTNLSLLNEVHAFKKEVATAMEQKQLMEEKYSDSTTHLELQQQYTQVLELELLRTQSKIEELGQELIAISTQTNEKENELKALHATLLHEQLNNLALLSNQEQLHTLFESSEAKFAAMEKRAAEIEQKFIVAEAESAQQLTQHLALLSQLEENEKEQARLSAQLDLKENEHLELVSRFNVKENEYAALSNLLKEKQTLHAELALALQQKECEQSDLLTLSTHQEQKLAVAENQLSENLAKHLVLITQLEANEKEHAQLMANLNQKENEKLEVAEQLLQRENHVRELQSEIEAKENLFYVTASMTNQEFEQTKSSLYQEIMQLRLELEDREQKLMTSISDQQKEHSSSQLAQAEIEQLRTDQQAIEARSAQQQRVIAEQLEERKSLLSAIEAAEKKFEANAQELKMALKHLDALALKHAEVHERNIDLEADSMQLTSSLSEREKERARAENALNLMEAEIVRLNQHLLAAHHEHQQRVSAIKSDDESTILLLNRRLNELALSLEKEMIQQNEMRDAIEKLVSHTNHQEESLGQSVRVNRTLQSENEFLKYRLKEAERAQSTHKAKMALMKRSDFSEDANTKTQPFMQSTSLLNPLFNKE